MSSPLNHRKKLSSKNFERILFIGDPLAGLQPSSDTTLYWLRLCHEQSIPCFWANADEIDWISGDCHLRVRAVLDAGSVDILPRLGPETQKTIRFFSLAFVRKEPPVDENYQKMCWLLQDYEKDICFFNRPSVLLKHHEKMIPFSALSQGVLDQNEIIDTCVTSSPVIAAQFASKLTSEHIIMKPWLGHGGRDIKLLDREDFCRAPSESWGSEKSWMIQKFEESIFDRGDRRVLVLNGQVIGDFVRLPKKGHFVSNLVRGGQAFLRDRDPSEDLILKKLNPWLLREGIHFAGLDFIGGKLSEVNITCPTGVMTYEKLSGKSLSEQFAEAFAALNSSHRLGSDLEDWLIPSGGERE